MTAQEFKTRILPCYQTMYNVVVRVVKNRDDSADVVQDVVRRLWERHAEIEMPACIHAFCVTVARNAALNHMRNCVMKKAELVVEPTAEITDDEPENSSDTLYRAIGRLPDNRRRLVLLSLRGLSTAQMAAELDISEGNVRQLLSRARHQLKSLITNINQQQ